MKGELKELKCLQVPTKKSFLRLKGCEIKIKRSNHFLGILAFHVFYTTCEIKEVVLESQLNNLLCVKALVLMGATVGFMTDARAPSIPGKDNDKGDANPCTEGK